MKETYLRSPIFYMGNKHKLLKQIVPLFPQEIRFFYDLFGGSGVVTMNVKADNKTYNEIDDNVIRLVKMVVENNPEDLDSYFKSKQNKYGLENFSIKRKDITNDKWFDDRKSKFKQLRDDYNNSLNKDIKDLYFLICYSINHLMRFNSSGGFNASSGNDSYNDKIYEQLKNMNNKFKDVKVFHSDYREVDVINDSTFVYVDPPYLNTTAVYNEKVNSWTIENDYELFEYLQKLNDKNIKWGLSNVFVNRGVENTHLKEWCEKNNWNIYHLNRNYNPFSQGNSNSDEVYVCNY